MVSRIDDTIGGCCRIDCHSLHIPGRGAIVLPLLLMSPLLVVVLVLLRGPGLFLLDVPLVSLRAALPGCRFAADVSHEGTVRVGVLRAIHEHVIVHVLKALCG